MTSSEHILSEGQILHEKWEILSFLAEGGKGEVYLARQINLDRHVALKVMSREFLRSLEGRDEEYESELQRFRREVRVMARIRHPNVLQVYDLGQVEVDGVSLDYIVMEYVPGPTLRRGMPEEGFQQEERALAEWLRHSFFPVLHGLEAVHHQGVVHRDMKPENVLIDGEIPKIADFGLAGGHNLENITRSFHMMGTPPYMPEEQFLDLATTDGRTDVYALGKILYEAIEGRMTPERNKPFETVHLSPPTTPMFRDLDRVVRNATAKDRSQRTPSVKDLRTELTRILEEANYLEKASAFKRYKSRLILTAAVGGAAVLLLAGIFGTHLYTMDSSSGPQTSQEAREGMVPSRAFEFDFSSREPTRLPRLEEEGSPPKTIRGSDGMALRLVPGGEARIPQNDQQSPEEQTAELTVTVPDFYLDETKVTNHLYVEFLRNISDLVVRDNAVWRNGRVWLYLGEVREGYEPIRYRDGKFKLASEAVSKPVVRVTALGAMAYAKFHGRSIPTMAQWWRALQAGSAGQGLQERQSPESRHGMMMDEHMGGQEVPGRETDGGNAIRNVSATRANALGIHGLGGNVNEWTMAVTGEERIELHIHGGVGDLDQRESYLKRRSWEGFSNVGFRTAIELRSKN
ncbi:MAG: protein kinase [Desulfohalobiaceae bacterium]|nr:protein kinase [Desulfohalobiaceae bacterium]